MSDPRDRSSAPAASAARPADEARPPAEAVRSGPLYGVEALASTGALKGSTEDEQFFDRKHA